MNKDIVLLENVTYRTRTSPEIAVDDHSRGHPRLYKEASHGPRLSAHVDVEGDGHRKDLKTLADLKFWRT